MNTYAGTGSAGYSGDGGTATSAMLYGPAGLAVDANGNLFIADTNNSRIRKVSGGTITTVAGGGTGAADGVLATQGQLYNPCDVKVDSAGNLYISESCVTVSSSTGGGFAVANRVVRVDAATGIMTTIAGGNTAGFGGDGGPPGSASLLNTPAGLAIDGSGTLYIADSGNNRIRRIDGSTGIITTVAGNGAATFAGDGGPATAASLNNPTAVAVDAAGNLYIADGGNGRIRRVDAGTGIITTFAGTGSTSFNGDAIPATSANVGFPTALLVNGAGNLLFTDVVSNRVRVIDNSTGLVWTVAGNGLTPPGCCDTGGPARPAPLVALNVPAGIALSPLGPLFISEHAGQQIRQVALQNPLVCTAVNLTASAVNASQGSPLTLTAVFSVMSGSPANVSIHFVDGQSGIGVAPLVNGSASFTTSSLQQGVHSITGQYFGDSVFVASVSLPVSVTITNQSSVALAVNPSPATAAQPVTLTATVTPSSATGSVNFFNGTASLGTASISNGTATLAGVTFTAGSYSLTAQYTGDINLYGSTSPAINLNVKAVSSVVLTSNVNPSSPGQAVTFTAAVSPSTAGGTFQFMDNGSTIGTSSTNASPAIFSISTLTSGTHSITVSYGGDANDASATSPALTQTVLSSSSVVIASSQNPSPVGGPVTFTASVTPANATGTVQFLDGTTVLGTGALSGGSASFTTSTLAQGTHYSITAVYSGDASNAGSTSAALIQTVKPIPVLTLASSLNPSTVGQTVTFTANVNNPGAIGSMQFLDGAAVLATVPVSSGAAAFSTSALTHGTHSISTSYSGDDYYWSAQSSTLSQTVNLIATTTTLASSQNPAVAGGAVTFIATVTPAAATGTVQFLDGTTVLGTGTLSNGSTSFTTSSLTQGTHSITAVYGGDTANAGSTSAVVSQSMKLSAGMTAGLIPSPGVTGQNVTLTANMVTAATGTVTFTDGSTVLATVPVSSGTASYSTTTLTQGSHTLGISYSGDATYMSQATTVAETILGATSISVASNVNPATTGQSVTFTATVTPAAATGNVQFYDGQTLIATVALGGGTAGYSTSALTPGTHSVTANYLGNSDYAPSFSNTLAEVVKTNTSVVLTSTPNPAFVGGAVSFTATVTPAAATGTVQFLDGTTVLGTGTLSNGSASFTTSALTQGTHSITAVYGGDTADAGSTSAALSQSMKLSAGMTTGLSPSPGVTGQNVTLTANMVAGATGTVTFTDGSTVLATVPVASGAASYSTTTLTQGSHTLGISYSGDATYMSQSTTVAETIQGATSISVASNVNPATTGQSVIFTATVTPAAATGNVQFYDGQTLVATVALSGGTAGYSTSALTPGTHSITANYLGDATYAQSFSSNTISEVVKTNTSVALTSTWNPSLVGGAVTFNAAVSLGTATGVVQFLDGATVLGTGTLSNGSASFATSALTQGTHSISAVYGGDAADTGSTSAVLSQSVKLLVGLNVGVSPNAPVAGQVVTLSATMNAAATGTVTFSDGSTVLATVAVASGAASFSTSSLAAGVHMLGFAYSGDATYMSSGTSFQQTIRAVSSIGLTSSANPSAAGQSVTFSAVVTPSTATGTVQVLDRGTVIGTATLASGIAVFSTSSLAAGAHSITASYGGDANDAPASSAAIAQSVKSVASVSLTSSANPSLIGQAVTFTAGVAPSTATGTVQFLDGSTVIGTVAVNSGTAALSTSQLAQGTHSITASYGGDANDTAATSATLAQTVNPPPPMAPKDLKATVASSTQINLAWTASPTSGVTYDVYSSTVNNFTPSASNRIASGVTATSYAVTGLSPATKYYFRVTAVNAGGESAATSLATATTKPH